MGFRLRWWTPVIWMLSAAVGFSAERPPSADPRAHAHNDYHHTRPLLDALAHGFGSVEADIFLVDGQLLVGHGRNELQPDRTLERLYLEPLARYIAGNPQAFSAERPLILLVDIKADGEAAYRALDRLLARYADWLTVVQAGQIRRGPVQIVVSGDRAVQAIQDSDPRYVGIDGRLEDLPSKAPVDLVPLISDNWGVHFRWRGEGEISDEERQKLAEYVRRVHDEGRWIRFWATPETREAWGELRRAGVDLINTDDLEGLEAFLREPERADSGA